MRVWNDLPADSKKEVIKRLDLMSRTAMRSTSRAHREIVDSTDFYVPRVRFSMKLADCMIMIYTGIEKFLRIEIDTREPGVMVYRMENTYNRSEATTRAIPSIGAYTLAYKILKSLFIHDTTLLGALEFEYYEDIFEVQKMTVAHMCRMFKGGRFRTKKLVTNCKMGQEPEMMIYKNVCDLEVLEVLVNDGIRLDTEELVPRKILDVTRIPDPKDELVKLQDGYPVPIQHFIHVPHHESQIWMAQERLDQRDMMIGRAMSTEGGFATMRIGNFPDEDDLWKYQNHPVERLNEHVLMKRIAIPQYRIAVRWNKSECGLWVHIMKHENEHKYLDYFKNEKCGLRWLCKKCTDPFEYWFYQQLPRRIYYEPEWCFTTLGLEIEDSKKVLKKLTREMRAQYAQDEKKRGKKKASAESWGFKQSTSPKKPPPKFIRGEDFDDLNGLVNAGKTLHVQMQDFEITNSEWIDYNVPKKSPHISIADKQAAWKKLAESKLFLVGGKFLGNMVPLYQSERLPEDLGFPECLDARLADEGAIEEIRKKFDALRGVQQPSQVVEQPSQAEKKKEKNRKKKEKKKEKKAQEKQGSSEEEGWQKA